MTWRALSNSPYLEDLHHLVLVLELLLQPLHAQPALRRALLALVPPLVSESPPPHTAAAQAQGS